MDCEDVSGFEGASEKKTGGVIEGNEDGGRLSLIALRKMLRKITQELEFVLDLRRF